MSENISRKRIQTEDFIIIATILIHVIFVLLGKFEEAIGYNNVLTGLGFIMILILLPTHIFIFPTLVLRKLNTLVPRPTKSIINTIFYSVPIIGIITLMSGVYYDWIERNDVVSLNILVRNITILTYSLQYGSILFFHIFFNFKVKNFLAWLLFFVMLPSCLLLFVSPDSHSIEESQESNNHIYYLASSYVPFTVDDGTIIFYECDPTGLNCMALHRRNYPSYPYYIVTEEHLNDAFLFEYGTHYPIMMASKPEWKIEPFFYREGILGEYEYGHSMIYQNNNAEIYMYRCLIPTRESCEMIPFRYTFSMSEIEDFRVLTDDFEDGNIIKTDVEKGEVSVYIDNQLIYTYGDSPQCFINGCEAFGDNE